MVAAAEPSPRIILASASPRRRELLSSIGVTFDVEPARVEEVPQDGEPVDGYVLRLSQEKAAEVAARHPEAWVIAADTVVYLDEELLEKPRDEEDAARMLARIAGKTHTVFTGVTLRNLSLSWSRSVVVTSRVEMIDLSPREIAWYVKTGEPMDKAGAYAVQGIGAMFIAGVEGSYTNVVGLPLAPLFGLMKEAGIDPMDRSLAPTYS